MENKYYELLKTWCDGLIDCQITEIPNKHINGSLICPACTMVHGRSYSLIHPFLYLARKTGEEKYKKSAIQLLSWSDNMACPDGGMVNDGVLEWKGTTAFSATALIKAYHFYGDVFDESNRLKLEKRVIGMMNYVCNSFDLGSGNINYVAGVACALALGGKYMNNPEWLSKAKECADCMMAHVTENNLIYGEGGHVWEERSPKGCLPIDIGYNVEETINLLAEYAEAANDEEVMMKVLKIAKAHVNFFLPDGGWNNSFASRMDKWTYWGSRTSDGCLSGYTMLSKYCAELKSVAERSFEILKACTHDGLLFGGRDVFSQGEPPCVHQTFTHAEGLVTMLEWLERNELAESKSTFEALQQSKYYPELDTHIYNSNEWVASITGYDSGEKKWCHPSGGALSMLFSKSAGPLLASSMSHYIRYEYMNTQRHLDDVDDPITMRMQIGDGRLNFANILDKKAVISMINDNEYFVNGHIVDDYGNAPQGGEIDFSVRYIFNEDNITVKFKHTGKDINIFVPIISEDSESVAKTDCGFIVEKSNANVEITSDGKLIVDSGKRIFNHVPGFKALQFKIINAAKETTFKIKICKNK